MKNEFKRFGVDGGWTSTDHLGGIEIKNGDKIDVLWPDKTVEQVKVQVVIITESVSDMGTPAETRYSEAYASVIYHGQPVRTRLVECKNIKGRFVTDVSGRKKINE